MNVKPGDLAYITHPDMLGKLVTVLHLAPPEDFAFPNGTLSAAIRWRNGDWVIQAMGAPFDVVRHRGGAGKNEYAVCNDRWLRPIRGDGLTDDVPADEQQPQATEA